MIRLVGPGGGGKSTIGALLAGRLNLAFLDLDRHLADRVGDIGEYIGGSGSAACGHATTRGQPRHASGSLARRGHDALSRAAHL